MWYTTTINYTIYDLQPCGEREREWEWGQKRASDRQREGRRSSRRIIINAPSFFLRSFGIWMNIICVTRLILHDFFTYCFGWRSIMCILFNHSMMTWKLWSSVVCVYAAFHSLIHSLSPSNMLGFVFFVCGRVVFSLLLLLLSPILRKIPYSMSCV